MADKILTRLAPYVRRLRAAEVDRERLQRALAAADIEYLAARQELDDVIADACKEIR